MQSVRSPEISLSITGATKGTLTVSDTTKIYPTAPASLTSSDGNSNLSVQVVEIISATQFTVRAAKTFDGSYQGCNYGLTDVSAYNGGVFTQYAAIIPVEYSYTKLFHA